MNKEQLEGKRTASRMSNYSSLNEKKETARGSPQRQITASCRKKTYVLMYCE